jgi:hypothetical protein
MVQEIAMKPKFYLIGLLGLFSLTGQGKTKILLWKLNQNHSAVN